MPLEVDDEDYNRELQKFRRRPLSEDTVRWLFAAAVVAGLLIVIFLGIVIEPDPKTAIQVVEQAGFTEGQVFESGIITFRCGDDSYYYRVRAKNPKGDVTEVTVCCGVFKDCTIRY